MSYLTRFTTPRPRSASSCSADQVPNSEGGFVWQVDCWTPPAPLPDPGLGGRLVLRP